MIKSNILINKRKYIVKIIVVKIILFLLLIFLNNNRNVIANIQEDILENEDNIIQEGMELADINGYLSSLQDFIDENDIKGIDLNSIKDELIKNNSINYKNLIIKILNIISPYLVQALSSFIIIYIIIVLIAIICNLELENKSDVTRVSYLICYLGIVIIMLKNFINIVGDFKDTITYQTTLMQIISPFLMAVIMATGKITSIGIIKPVILFIASLIGFIINYIVIPFLCISVILSIISNISENLNLSKLSKLFKTSSMWIISVSLTLFIGILSIEATFSTSVDKFAIKTAQTAVSNFVPVVGKFFSDSFETVVGAIEVITNASGIIGIIVIIVISLIPILKITFVMLMYMILESLAEPICHDKKLLSFISSFVELYKVLIGILIGVAILNIISVGIIVKIGSSVIS